MKAIVSPLCKCNFCEIVMIDENPQVDAIHYPISGDEPEMVWINDGEDSHWACHNCLTDDYLIDL